MLRFMSIEGVSRGGNMSRSGVLHACTPFGSSQFASKATDSTGGRAFMLPMDTASCEHYKRPVPVAIVRIPETITQILNSFGIPIDVQRKSFTSFNANFPA